MKTIVLIILCALVACNKIESGTVIERIYEPSEKRLVLIPTRVGNVTIFHQHWHYDDEDFILVVENNDTNEKITRRVHVSKSCFDAAKVGDDWYKSLDCSFTDDNNYTIKDN